MLKLFRYNKVIINGHIGQTKTIVYEKACDTTYALSGLIRVKGFDEKFVFNLVSTEEHDNLNNMQDWLEGKTSLSVLTDITRVWKPQLICTYSGNMLFSKELGKQAIVEITFSGKLVIDEVLS